jgi:hypothetical protein
MIINSSLPVESTAAAPRHSRANPAPPQIPTDPAPDRMLELRAAGQDEDGADLDPKAADAWTGFLHSNILSQAGTALAAQANQNPETVFSLLR